MPPQPMPSFFVKDMGFAGRRKLGMIEDRRVQRNGHSQINTC